MTAPPLGGKTLFAKPRGGALRGVQEIRLETLERIYHSLVLPVSGLSGKPDGLNALYAHMDIVGKQFFRIFMNWIELQSKKDFHGLDTGCNHLSAADI